MIEMSREEAFRWVSDEFNVLAIKVYEDSGSPKMETLTGWAIFNAMAPPIWSVLYDIWHHKPTWSCFGDMQCSSIDKVELAEVPKSDIGHQKANVKSQKSQKQLRPCRRPYTSHVSVMSISSAI
jgi:hypothetical protein